MDIDGDGDLDAFVGEFDGNTNFFRNTSTNSSIPAFNLESSDNAFGLSDIGYVSQPTFVDIDADGDLDAFVGETNTNTNFFRNTSTNSSIPAFNLESSDNAFGLSETGGLSSPTFVDIDADGDLDAFVGDIFGNTNFFRNTSTNSSIPAFNIAFGLSDIGEDSSPTFVDIDGDGDLDAFVGERDGNTNFFRNTSTNSSIPAFNLESSDNAFGLSDIGYISHPTFVDIDGDGDLDAFIGAEDGNIHFFRNTSTNSSIPAFNLESSDNAFGLSDIGRFNSPTFVDIDGDGDLDAFVGEYAGNTNFFRNSNSSVPAFNLESSNNAFGISDIGVSSSPTFVDIDGDGDLDAFVGERDGNTNFFRNISTNSFIPAFTLEIIDNAFGISDIGSNSSPTFVDIDGDGDLDAFVGEFQGKTVFFKNSTPDIALEGNSMDIPDGDTTPQSADDTDFGSANVTGGMVSKTFTIKNTGGATLNLGTLSILGTNMADFSVSTPPLLPLLQMV